MKHEADPRPFCYCGLLAVKKVNGGWLCKKHNVLKKERTKIGNYSGKSKSEHAFGDYK
jgi:hypothetical protein